PARPRRGSAAPTPTFAEAKNLATRPKHRADAPKARPSGAARNPKDFVRSEARAQLAQTRNHVEDVPMLRTSECRLSVLLDLVEAFEFEEQEQRLRLHARVERHVVLRRPFVSLSEELAAEAAAGTERIDDPVPHD